VAVDSCIIRILRPHAEFITKHVHTPTQRKLIHYADTLPGAASIMKMWNFLYTGNR